VSEQKVKRVTKRSLVMVGQDQQDWAVARQHQMTDTMRSTTEGNEQ
jgi:hypothetical protein